MTEPLQPGDLCYFQADYYRRERWLMVVESINGKDVNCRWLKDDGTPSGGTFGASVLRKCILFQQEYSDGHVAVFDVGDRDNPTRLYVGKPDAVPPILKPWDMRQQTLDEYLCSAKPGATYTVGSEMITPTQIELAAAQAAGN